MTHERAIDLAERACAAAKGDKVAAHAILEAVQDDIYGLALRMLGQPADAEDAAQEILVIVLTHLGSFRGESELFLSRQLTGPANAELNRATDEVTSLMHVAEVMRGPSTWLAPGSMVKALRELVDSQRLELFRS